MAALILGIGTSHSPMLNVGIEDWARFIERDSKRPQRDKEGREVSYDELVRLADPAIGPRITAEFHRANHRRAQEAIERLAQAIERAKLDALIVVGDDQKELFQESNLPSFLVYRGASMPNVLAHGRKEPDWYLRALAGYYEKEGARDYPVAADLAHHLIGAFVEREFDVATANAVPEGMGEGHAFGFVHQRLMRGAPIPIVPVFINTYYPPNQPTPRRCYELGRAIRAAVESYPGGARIGIAASGGLSHITIDEALDGVVIRAIKNKDARALASLPVNKLNAGSSEIRNWVCAAGALEHLDNEWLEYVPAYRTPAGTGTGLCFSVWS